MTLGWTPGTYVSTCVVREVKIILSIFRNFANGMNMQQVISDIFAAEVSK